VVASHPNTAVLTGPLGPCLLVMLEVGRTHGRQRSYSKRGHMARIESKWGRMEVRMGRSHGTRPHMTL
jgi:hypothetical protein